MPIGVIVDLCGVLLGCLLGSKFGSHLGQSLRSRMTMVFGFCALSMGISLIGKVGSLAPTVSALIVGTLLGECMHLEERTNRRICVVSMKLLRNRCNETYLQDFCTVAVLFCFSGPGLVGALTEGFAGNHGLLLAKSVMDFFTAIIFSSALGGLVAIICVPQAFILMALFAASHFLMPLFSDGMLANFYAVGGIITVMAGFNMLKLLRVHIINVLPALVLAPVFTSIFPV